MAKLTVEGLDVVVRDLTTKAALVQPLAAKTVVEHAGKAAQHMRDSVAIHSGKTLGSIDSDSTPTVGDGGVYADAGPDHFVSWFLERGTVKMSPQPFVGPAADKTIPEFEQAIGRLADLL